MLFLNKKDLVMKKISALSLVLLFASAQIHGEFAGAANPDLLFALAYQSVQKLQNDIAWDSDDLGAQELLDAMNKCVQFDAQQQQALDASKNSFLYKGVPLDPAKIEAQNKDLEQDIKNISASIKRLEGSSDTLKAVNKSNHKLQDRRSDRKAKQKQLDENKAAIKANEAAMSTAKNAEAQIKVLREKNALAFEQALESYINLYGQAYSQNGSIWGSSIVISSKRDQNIAITPKEYDQLMAVLKSAVAPFGTGDAQVMIMISQNHPEATISQVISYIGNMPVPSTRTWAQFGINLAIGTAIIAGAAVAVNAAVNYSQDKDWNDTSNAQDLVNQAMQSQAGQQFAAMMDQANQAGLVASQRAAALGQDTLAAGKAAFDAVAQSQAGIAAQDAYLGALKALGYQAADSNPADQKASLLENAENNAFPAPDAAIDPKQVNSWWNMFGGN